METLAETLAHLGGSLGVLVSGERRVPAAQQLPWDGNSNAFQPPAWYWWDAVVHLNGQREGVFGDAVLELLTTLTLSLSSSCSSSLPCSHS